jgi:putative hemolysin
MVDITQIVLLIILLILSGVFSGIETAFFSLSNLKVRSLLKLKKKGSIATVYKLKQNPRRLIITILIGNNIVNIGAAALATVIAIDLFGSSGAGIATGIMTLLILLFGEITPKSIASVYSEKISLIVAKPILLFMYLIFPVVLLFESITKVMHRIFNIENKDPIITEEEFKTLVEIGAEEKVLKRKSKELIEGVLDFEDITAKEVMTPRTKMLALDQKIPLNKALKEIAESPFSRVPIYKKNVDNIVGVVHIKDILRYVQRKKTKFPLRTVSRKPYFVPEGTIISNLFKEFQEKNIHMAIVVDEFGGVSGVVTLEDLIEEIVGEIIDETDIKPELIMRIDKNAVVVHGDTEIDHLNHFFGIDLPTSKRAVTVGGLMVEKLRRIPRKGTKFQVNNVSLTVEEVGTKRILKVRVRKMPNK